MNGDGVGQRQLVELPEIVSDFAVLEFYHKLAFGWIDFGDLADIAVEGLFVVIILGLDDFVAEAESISKPLHLYFACQQRIQGRL